MDRAAHHRGDADRARIGPAAAVEIDLRARLVAGPLSTKIYFDGGCRPNPGAIEVAAVVRGAAHLRFDLGEGSSGDAEWSALLHALAVAAAAGEADVILLGDSASVISQASGTARFRGTPEVQTRFAELTSRFDRLRFRRIKRTQNLAGIALEQGRRRSA